jgi:predicted RNA-binding Zn-ribbon protein involved in translation (DUF1610 family)
MLTAQGRCTRVTKVLHPSPSEWHDHMKNDHLQMEKCPRCGTPEGFDNGRNCAICGLQIRAEEEYRQWRVYRGVSPEQSESEGKPKEQRDSRHSLAAEQSAETKSPEAMVIEKCSSWGQPIPATERSCPNCGRKRKTPMAALQPCPDCGMQVSTSALSCPHCGRKLKESQSATGLLAAIIIGLGHWPASVRAGFVLTLNA